MEASAAAEFEQMEMEADELEALLVEDVASDPSLDLDQVYLASYSQNKLEEVPEDFASVPL